MNKLKIENLQVAAGEKEIIKNLSLEIKPGEIHALMGPNGSGKSSLALALAGHPNYRITAGKVSLGKKEITFLKPEERAKAGLFLAFQYPVGISGVSIFNFLKTAVYSRGEKLAASKLLSQLESLADSVDLNKDFLSRDLNLDLSGGEKKRAEVLQAFILKPKFAIFDEIDSGLDIDALKTVAKQIGVLVESGTGVLVVTHYQRILSNLRPDFVHVLTDGQIVESGGSELAGKLEKRGYQHYV